jgi:hypothetical protein
MNVIAIIAGANPFVSIMGAIWQPAASRNKLANGLAAFGLTRVRDSESRHRRQQFRILQHLLCRNGKPAYSALECLHFG